MEHFPSVRLPDLNPKPRVIVYDVTGELSHTLSRYADEIDLVDVGSRAQAVEAQQKLPAHAVIMNAPASSDLTTLIESLSNDIPNTAIVGCAFPSARKQAWEAHAMDYLVNPVARDRLKQAVQLAPGRLERVLIVDDDPDVAKLLTRMLLTFAPELQIESADGGCQALQMMQTQRPDLILLDVVMPESDGWQFLNDKNANPEWQDIPVIFVTAQDPNNRPVNSPSLVVAINNGFSAGKLIRCAMSLSATLLQPG